MQRSIFMIFILLCAFSPAFAQFSDDDGATEISNNNFNAPMRRLGSTGFGAYNATFNLPTTLLQVRASGANSQISHVEQGAFGAFAAGNTWLGLGKAGGIATAYGLGIADNANIGVFNLLEEGAQTNLIAGFGGTATTNNNRFIVRGFAGAMLTPTNLMVVNPNGATGINAEPLASLWVDANETRGGLARSIAIIGQQRAGPADITTASAIGNQQNASLAASRIAAEGFRAQFPDFATAANNIANPPQTGGAVNLQVVNNPLGVADVIAGSSSLPGATEYGELTWQDLDFDDDAVTDCNTLSIPDAEGLDKFFISFRNNRNVNPFDVDNKLPVMTFQGNGRVGIATLQPTSSSCGTTPQPVFLDVNGLIVSGGALVSSDRRFKQNIAPISNSLQLVRSLRGSAYTFDTRAYPERHFSGGKQYGFIAQEVAEVAPELTLLNSDGYYAVNYTMLVPVLTEAIKEQDEVIRTLQDELAELRRTVADLKADRTSQSVEGFRLDQNAPNPFSNGTVIGYALPAGTAGAVISVYDLTGRTLRSFYVSDSQGQITLNAGDLPAGLYLYDLQVNGRQVLERRMSVSRN